MILGTARQCPFGNKHVTGACGKCAVEIVRARQMRQRRGTRRLLEIQRGGWDRLRRIDGVMQMVRP
jgi:hypothetical protein